MSIGSSRQFLYFFSLFNFSHSWLEMAPRDGQNHVNFLNTSDGEQILIFLSGHLLVRPITDHRKSRMAHNFVADRSVGVPKMVQFVAERFLLPKGPSFRAFTGRAMHHFRPFDITISFG